MRPVSELSAFMFFQGENCCSKKARILLLSVRLISADWEQTLLHSGFFCRVRQDCCNETQAPSRSLLPQSGKSLQLAATKLGPSGSVVEGGTVELVVLAGGVTVVCDVVAGIGLLGLEGGVGVGVAQATNRQVKAVQV